MQICKSYNPCPPQPLLSKPKQWQEGEKQWLVTDKRQTCILSLKKKKKKEHKKHFSVFTASLSFQAFWLRCQNYLSLFWLHTCFTRCWNMADSLCRFLGNNNRTTLSFRWLYTNHRQSPEPIAWLIMCTSAGGLSGDRLRTDIESALRKTHRHVSSSAIRAGEWKDVFHFMQEW